MAKGSQLRNYLEVHSLSSDQVFFSIPLKTFSKFSRGTFKWFFFGYLIVVQFISDTYDQKQLSS